MQAFCSTYIVSYVRSSTQESVLTQALPASLTGMETNVFVKNIAFFSEHVIYGISLSISRINFAEISDIHPMI